MTVENISWSISTKECCQPRRGLNPRPPGLQLDGASNRATEASIFTFCTPTSEKMELSKFKVLQNHFRNSGVNGLIFFLGYFCNLQKSPIYEGCSKWIAYFYLETSNFKLAQKYSFHALEVLPVARNAKFQPMYPLLEGVTVYWFGHSNKVLMNGRSKCLSGLVFPPSKECFQFRKQKETTWGKVWGIRGVRQNSYFFFLQKTP